ncbi:MAG: response regulator [Bacillales bacterium]|jgi:PAS domain S-box-containing protein|nr:response regulator [Bacillales bacterium]
MGKKIKGFFKNISNFFKSRKLKTKLLAIFLTVKIVPITILVLIVFAQFGVLQNSIIKRTEDLRKQVENELTVAEEIAVSGSNLALINSASDPIERMTTDTAKEVAEMLYNNDNLVQIIANAYEWDDLTPTNNSLLLKNFVDNYTSKVIKQNTWRLVIPDENGSIEYNGNKVKEIPLTNEAEREEAKLLKNAFWAPIDVPNLNLPDDSGNSTNKINEDDGNGNGILDDWRYREPDYFEYEDIPLFNQISFIDLNGQEQLKYTAPQELSQKVNHYQDLKPNELNNVLVTNGEVGYAERFTNTYIKAEEYPKHFNDFPATKAEYQALSKDEKVYVSDVRGAYVRGIVGMYAGYTTYTPYNVESININNTNDNLIYLLSESNKNGKGITPLARLDGETADAFIDRALTWLVENHPEKTTNYPNSLRNVDSLMSIGKSLFPENDALDYKKLTHPGYVNADGSIEYSGWKTVDFYSTQGAFAGKENPLGERFEGIIRWLVPVYNNLGDKVGYIAAAFNADHLMEKIDHITPMIERYSELSDAGAGNYAFIWDSKIRSVAHPRHNSIYGYNAVTGDPEIPWLYSKYFDKYVNKLGENPNASTWYDYFFTNSSAPNEDGDGTPEFFEQNRPPLKTPAQILTDSGLVGLDGRWLNNAPQCTGWADISRDGGSGSFYILWSGLYKITTVSAIPYYSGQYNELKQGNRRGFGIVTIGAGFDDFLAPARETDAKLKESMDNANELINGSVDDSKKAVNDSLSATTNQVFISLAIIIAIVIVVAYLTAGSITKNIDKITYGITKFRSGERQFRFNSTSTDEFGIIQSIFDDMASSIEESIKNPIIILDENLKIVYLNNQALSLNNIFTKDSIGTSFNDAVEFDYDSPYHPINALEKNQMTEIFFSPRSQEYLKSSASYFYDRNGEKKGYVIEIFNVTEMVREQQRLETQRLLLDKIFSSSPDLIFYIDTDNKYLTVNPRYASISGLSPEEFVGKSPIDIYGEEAGSAYEKMNSEAKNSGISISAEQSLVFADGHIETVDTVRTPLSDSEGKYLGILGFSRDVSNRVAVENNLRNTQLALEKAVIDANESAAHKTDFLARMSHEIRTPMNAIIGVTSIVKNELSPLVIKQKELNSVMVHVGQIETSSQHLLGLLNDILDLSKIDAGKIELANEDVDMRKLFDSVVNIISPRFVEKNITFKYHMDTLKNDHFSTDSLRLRQVLINLLGNAVKFTRELGTVTFNIIDKGNIDGKTILEFTVSDTGIGISKSDIPNLFRSFEQANSSISKKFGGTGLGLAISQKIIQMLGSEIKVTSVLEEGTTFSFEIALSTVNESDAEVVEIVDATNRFKGKRILLVDDVDINRMIVVSLLEITGASIEEAEDGTVAVQKFTENNPNYYDIIFMDIRMPIMDGYEATKSIRAIGSDYAKKIPIIALTANAFKEDIDAAKAAGMNSHVAKPVDYEKLIEQLFKYLKVTNDK